MRTALTAISVICITGANAIAGAFLVAEVSTALVGQYVSVIVFLVGVGATLAKIVQSLYTKIIADKDKRIAHLEEQLAKLREETK